MGADGAAWTERDASAARGQRAMTRRECMNKGGGIAFGTERTARSTGKRTDPGIA
jgi:hypothetical protein